MKTLRTSLATLTLAVLLCLHACAYSAAKTVSGLTSGLSTVGYTLYNPSTGAVAVARTTTGVHETATGSGIYTALITPPDSNSYTVVWDSGETTPVYASDPINPGAAATDPLTNPVSTYTTPGTIGYVINSAAITATGIKSKTDLIATNGGDSPNEVTAQGGVSGLVTSVAALPTVNAIANGILGFNLFPSYSVQASLRDIWSVTAGPSTVTYPTSLTQVTHYTQPDGTTSQTGSTITNNAGGKPITRIKNSN